MIFFLFAYFFIPLQLTMIETDISYWHGIAASFYLTSCIIFAIVRWFHVCQAPKDQRSYIWPDRKLQVIVYTMAILLLPYIINPTNPRAWTLWKLYFPGTYYFYIGVLLFCYFGTVKQWNSWKNASWVAAIIVSIAMVPLVLDAWIPGGMLKQNVTKIWENVVLFVSIYMMGYCGIAVWQVRRWIKETSEENYSNPDDFPEIYARRVWAIPVWITPLIWAATIFDNPSVMAACNILLALFNIILLLIAMPPWRRTDFVCETEEVPEELEESEWRDEQQQERSRKIAEEIEAFVRIGKGFLNPHLKIDNVVEHCSYSRTYVSRTFKTHYGGFSRYVNRLRLNYFDNYMKQHPDATKDAAAQESGFISYTAYYKVKDRLERE